MAFETTKQIKYVVSVDGADKLRQSFTSVGAAMRGMNKETSFATQAFAGLVGAASIGGFMSMINGAIDAKARLYDLGLQTGISVEALSGLRRVAKYSSTSLDDIAGASNKLSKALNTTNEDSTGAAQAIKALGLNFDQFKALGADEQLLQVANAMEGFRDGTGKSAAAMLLFGKTGATLLPFLKELAERGIAATRETTAGALAAKQYADNLITLQDAGEQWRRHVVGDMLPALTQLTTQLAEAKTTTGRLGVAFNYLADNNHFSSLDLERKSLERLNLERERTSLLFDSMLRAQEAEPYNRAYAQRVVELRTQLNMLGKASAEASEALKRNANLLSGAGLAGGGRGFVNPAGVARPELGIDSRTPKTAVHDAYDGIMAKIRERMALDQEQLTLGRELTATERFQVEVMADVDKSFGKMTMAKMLGIDSELQLAVALGKTREEHEASTKWMGEYSKVTDQAAEAQRHLISRSMEEFEGLQRLHDEYGLSSDEIERNSIGRQRNAAALVLSRRAVDEYLPGQAEMNRMLELEAKLLNQSADIRVAIANKRLRDRNDPMTGAKNAAQAYFDDLTAAGLNTGRFVTNTLHGLEDGLTELFTKGKWDARSFVDTLISEFIRLRVVKPLMADLLSPGNLLGSLFGLGGSSSSGGLAAIGNMGAAFLIPGLATGGSVQSGSPYLVGERGPELFVPRTSGAIVPNGATSGRRVVVNASNVFNIEARTDRAQVAELVARGVAQGNQHLVELLHAQGAL